MYLVSMCIMIHIVSHADVSEGGDKIQHEFNHCDVDFMAH